MMKFGSMDTEGPSSCLHITYRLSRAKHLFKGDKDMRSCRKDNDSKMKAVEREIRNHPDDSEYEDTPCYLYVAFSPENFCAST